MNSSQLYKIAMPERARGGFLEFRTEPRMIYSCRETPPFSPITQREGPGMVSREAAQRNGLTIYPGFKDFLEVRLAANNPDLSSQALSDMVDLRSHERVEHNVRSCSNRHTEKEFLLKYAHNNVGIAA